MWGNIEQNSLRTIYHVTAFLIIPPKYSCRRLSSRVRVVIKYIQKNQQY